MGGIRFNMCNQNGTSNIGYGWVIDSGANQHYVTSERGLVNVEDISDLNLSVDHPNGTCAKITKIGNYVMSKYVTLLDVLVVPNYTINLLSIYKLARDSKKFIGFSKKFIGFDDRKGRSWGRLWGPVVCLMGYITLIIRVCVVTIHVQLCLLTTMQQRGMVPDFVLCVGDDRSDKDMFEAITRAMAGPSLSPVAEVFACTVGRKPSKARYFLEDSTKILRMLQALATASELRSLKNVTKGFQKVTIE